VIPEIDIWRAAQLMLKRYGDNALEESMARADELTAVDDQNGAATWRRIADAVVQLANKIPPGPVH
jgi:dTDP-4-dehydrorhamnose reductase